MRLSSPSIIVFVAAILVASASASRLAEKVSAGDAGDPFSDLLKCAQQTSSPDQCTSTTISDGQENCVYCTSETVKQSVCTTPQASQAMKGVIPDLNCGDDDEADEAEAAASRPPNYAAILKEHNMSYPDHLVCMDQSEGSVKQCTSTKTSDGESCVYCQSKLQHYASCFTSHAAHTMMVGPDTVSDFVCTPTKESIKDLLLCASQNTGGGASSDECTGTATSDGEHCVVDTCSSKAANQNVCTTASASSSILKQLVKDLQCGEGYTKENKADQLLVKNPSGVDVASE